MKSQKYYTIVTNEVKFCAQVSKCGFLTKFPVLKRSSSFHLHFTYFSLSCLFVRHTKSLTLLQENFPINITIRNKVYKYIFYVPMQIMGQIHSSHEYYLNMVRYHKICLKNTFFASFVVFEVLFAIKLYAFVCMC